MNKNKSIKIGVSLPAALLDAAKSYATIATSNNLSRLMSDALREYLAAHNALPTTDAAEKQALIAGLFEAVPIDELKALLAHHTAAAAAAEGER